MNNDKRLYRSNTNRMIGGVCAGIGEFFGIDATVIRLLFVFGVIFGWGSMLVVYLIMLVVVPEGPGVMPPPPPAPPAPPIEPEV
ncbi:MAG TPA: PspC domain-containing protein [Anaerolineales bacterium]|nr:PspC domain-containing protein [Anaerolineales bacterium]